MTLTPGDGTDTITFTPQFKESIPTTADLGVSIQLQGDSQIADELLISKETAKVHTRNIYKKLQANTKAEAVSIAFEKKIITR